MDNSRPPACDAPRVMNDAEYARMDELEEVHWWYVGLRDLIARCLVKFGMTERSDAHVLDAGCGTGANLRMCAECLPAARLYGFDVSERALACARHKVPQAELVQADVCDLRLPDRTYDVILSCDVLQITGIDAALEGMKRLAGQLRPGGLLIINLPAYQWLFSRHDVAVATRYRFTRRQLRDLVGELKLQPEWLTYRLWALFPAVVASRLPFLQAAEARGERGRSDLRPVNRQVNAALALAVRAENLLIGSGVSFPWGSSVFAVARRPPSGPSSHGAWGG